MRRFAHAILISILATGAAARAAADVAATLTAAAEENRASLSSFATRGCAGLKERPAGLRVLEMQFLGGQSTRLLVVNVFRHGEVLDVTFYTPGTSALSTRSLKVRPGAPPVWMSADKKGFPINDELRSVPIEAAAYAAIRNPNETAACYVARLAQDYVRPRDFADAAAGGGGSAEAGR